MLSQTKERNKVYSPYLYGRGSELLALRSLIKNEVDIDKLLPIIEPVVTNKSNIIRCMSEYAKAEKKLVVIINPAQNEFKDNLQEQKEFRNETAELFSNNETLIPGYIVGPHSTKKKIDTFLALYPDRPVAILYNSSPLSDQDFKIVADNANILYHIVINERISLAQYKLIPKKKIIEVRDNFNKLKKNADYDGAEFFTDRHKLVGKEFLAIGDYTITGRVLEIGGGRPGAVAIHATYKHKNEDVWVEHFVSEDKDRDVGDVSTKFLQAATKLVSAVDKRPKEFGSDEALDIYRKHVAEGTFSGLPKNKEHQLYHHICLMLSVIP